MSELRTEAPGDKPKRKWLTPVVGVLLWLTSVGILTSAIAGTIRFVRSTGIPQQAQIDGWLWSSREQKLAALRENYVDHQWEITDPRREEIEKFLKSLVVSYSDEETEKWIEKLDEDRFRDRVMNSPWVKSLSLLDRPSFAAKKISEMTIEAPNRFTGIEIVNIVPWGDGQKYGIKSAYGDEVLVFTLASRNYFNSEPVLFWLRESGGAWKLVDWENVDSGSSESEGAGQWEWTNVDRVGNEFSTANESLLAADQLAYTNESEFARQLRRAEACRIPTPSQDLLRYMVISRWNHRRRYEDVRRLAGDFREADRFPGVHLMRATACQSLGEPEKALQSLALVDQLTGFRPRVEEMRARLLHQLHRRDEAASAWRRLVEYSSNNVSYLIELYDLLPKSERSQVFERIKSQKKPVEVALQFVRYYSDRLTSAEVQDLSQFVKSISPDSTEAREIEVLRLVKEHQHLAAAALYRSAIDSENDPNSKKQLWASYLQQMFLGGETLAGFAEHPDPKAAFRILLAGDDDGPSVSLEEAGPLLDAYRQKCPDDPWLRYYEGWAAANEQRFAVADVRLAEAETIVAQKKQDPPKKDVPEDGDEEDSDEANETSRLVNLLKHQRCRVGYELGEDVEILTRYQHDEGVYQTLAGIAMQYRHWPALTRLNRSLATAHPENPWVLYYDAQIFLATKKFGAVGAKLEELRRREEQVPGLKYSREELEGEFLKAQYADPARQFAASSDRAATFRQLTLGLLADRNWSALEMFSLTNQAGADEFDLLNVRLEMAWRKSEDEQLVSLLKPWPTATMSRRPYFEPIWRERLIRSLLKLNRIDEALEAAQAAQKNHEEFWPLAAVYVAKRDAAALADLLRDEESLAQGWSDRNFFDDELFRPVLLDDAFAEIRSDRTFSLNAMDEDWFVLLLQKPIDLTEAWLKDRLTEQGDQQGGDVSNDATNSAPQIVEVPVPARGPADNGDQPVSTSKSFIVQWKGSRFIITSSDQPFFSSDYLQSPGFTKRKLDRARGTSGQFSDQKAWLRIAQISEDGPQPWNSPKITNRELGARLLNEDVIGAIHANQSSTFMELVWINSSKAKLVASRRPFSELDDEAVVLSRHRPVRGLALDKKRQIQKLADTAESTPSPGPMTVQVQLGTAEIPLIATCRVIKVHTSRFGELKVDLEYTGNDPFPGMPEIRPGTRWSVPIDRIVEID